MVVLRSLRALVFGETWTIPVGVGAALALAVGLRAALSSGFWRHAGGFILAGVVVATLAVSVARSGRPRR